MDPFSMTFASGFASGINAYATVFIIGLLGKYTHVAAVPEGFQRTDVLIAMGVLALLDFVADKIPYLDSAWDTVNTFIRPIAGATIGALIAGAHGDLVTIALASVGGITALLSHVSKAGLRMAINTSPEPVTNWSHSVANDVTVTSVATTAALFPVPAAIAAGVLLVIGLVLAFVLYRTIRQGFQRFRTWWANRSGGNTTADAT